MKDERNYKLETDPKVLPNEGTGVSWWRKCSAVRTVAIAILLPQIHVPRPPLPPSFSYRSRKMWNSFAASCQTTETNANAPGACPFVEAPICGGETPLP